MKRRNFIGITCSSAAGLATVSCNTVTKTSDKKATQQTPCGVAQQKKLAKQYEEYLFQDFLPFMERYVIDHERGGFLCNTDREGKNITTNKSSWYEGRGIWVYSYLYNNVSKEQKYFDVAQKSVNFLAHLQPVPPLGLMPRVVTVDGEPVVTECSEIYGDLFIAEGYAEFSKACGDHTYWDRAKDIVFRCVDIYEQPDYRPQIGQTYLGRDARPFPGARILGVWMVLIRVATQMLRIRPDRDLEALSRRCIDAILEHHYNSEFGLLNELINHDFSRPDNEYAQLVYTGHAIETLWMVMDEAVRRRNRALFEKAAALFKRHFEVAWDDVYGGVFRNLQHVNNNTWEVDKVLWAQEEVLIGSLMIVEHLGEDWAWEIFTQMYDYVLEKYPLQKYGYALWNLGADRKVTFKKEFSRVGNYHHPRHLMLNLVGLRRMQDRSGAVSTVFA